MELYHPAIEVTAQADVGPHDPGGGYPAVMPPPPFRRVSRRNQ
jgi:hypothetical protein